MKRNYTIVTIYIDMILSDINMNSPMINLKIIFKSKKCHRLFFSTSFTIIDTQVKISSLQTIKID